MNRRQFTQRLAAVAALPSVPIPATATPIASANTVTYGMNPYVWAKYTARINKHLSPELLQTALGFGRTESANMMTRLVKERVLSPPNALGVCQTSTEYLRSFSQKESLVKASNSIREFLDEKLEKASEKLANEVISEDTDHQQEDAPSIADNSPQA